MVERAISRNALRTAKVYQAWGAETKNYRYDRLSYLSVNPSMKTTKVAITLDQALLVQLDRLVDQQVFPNRSKAIQAAIEEKLERLNRTRLARECAKLNPTLEQAFAEAGMEYELETWSEY